VGVPARPKGTGHHQHLNHRLGGCARSSLHHRL